MWLVILLTITVQGKSEGESCIIRAICVCNINDKYRGHILILPYHILL